MIHRAFNATTNAFVQRAALVALADAGRYPRQWLETFGQRRALAYERLCAIDGLTVQLPEGGFYVFPRYAAPIVSTALAARMQAAGVSVRAGLEYGPSGERHFRISFATDIDRLERGLDRVAAVFRELKETL